MLMGVLALMSAIVATYIGLYMSTYALTVLALPPATAAWGTIATSAGLAAGSLSGGLLADRHGLRRVMMVPRALAIVLIVPCFQLLLWLPGVWTLLLVAFALALFGAVSAAALITVVTAAFPRAVRSSGLAITYALAVTLFGSTTQFVIAWLAGVTGNPLAPAYYGIATGLISLWAMNGLPLREPD
jgi:MFS family permease